MTYKKMSFDRNHQLVTLTVGGMQHTVQTDTLLKYPAKSVLGEHVSKARNNSKEGSPVAGLEKRDGHAFPYILHYLETGELIYPLHEGYQRVDALLKEIAYYGLDEDLLRKANFCRRRKKESAHYKQNSVNQKRPLQKSISLQSENYLNEEKDYKLYTSTTSLSTLTVNSTENIPPRDRFKNFIKKYVSLRKSKHSKSTGVNAEQEFPEKNVNEKLVIKSNNHRGRRPSINLPFAKEDNYKCEYVFHPPAQQGSTIIVACRNLRHQEEVCIYGQQKVLTKTLPGYQAVGVRGSYSQVDARIGFNIDTTKGKEWQAKIFNKNLYKDGFSLTVESQWIEHETGAVRQQWLLYKKSGSGFGGKGSASRRASISLEPKGPAEVSPYRKRSTLRRIFTLNV